MIRLSDGIKHSGRRPIDPMTAVGNYQQFATTDELIGALGDSLPTNWRVLELDNNRYVRLDYVNGSWVKTVIEDGSLWLSGAGEPNNSQGNNNDIYLNTTTGDVFKKTSGEWSAPIINIKGQDAPAVKIEFSQDGITFHETFESDDKYIRFSIDGGLSWMPSNGVKFVGDNASLTQQQVDELIEILNYLKVANNQLEVGTGDAPKNIKIWGTAHTEEVSIDVTGKSVIGGESDVPINLGVNDKFRFYNANENITVNTPNNKKNGMLFVLVFAATENITIDFTSEYRNLDKVELKSGDELMIMAYISGGSVIAHRNIHSSETLQKEIHFVIDTNEITGNYNVINKRLETGYIFKDNDNVNIYVNSMKYSNSGKNNAVDFAPGNTYLVWIPTNVGFDLVDGDTIEIEIFN